MSKWWWVGVAGIVVGLGGVAAWQASPTPTPAPLAVVETESMVDRQGRLVENELGTARIGYGLVMDNQEKLFLDLSELAGASVAGYLNRQVLVTGPIVRRQLYDPAAKTWDETETRYMLVKQIKVAP